MQRACNVISGGPCGLRQRRTWPRTNRSTISDSAFSAAAESACNSLSLPVTQISLLSTFKQNIVNNGSTTLAGLPCQLLYRLHECSGFFRLEVWPCHFATFTGPAHNREQWFGLIYSTSMSAWKRLYRRSVTDLSPHRRTDPGSQCPVFSDVP